MLCLHYLLSCIFFLMIRRPPRSTRTDTLFPYTTLFRSLRGPPFRAPGNVMRSDRGSVPARSARAIGAGAVDEARHLSLRRDRLRSEERRVGKECVNPCRSRWSPFHLQNNEICMHCMMYRNI